MIILIALFLIIGSPHLIISVAPSNSIVSANDQLAIKILTSAAISANALAISLTTDFTLASPCLINGTAVACSFVTTTTAVTATISSAFLASTYYTVTLNVTNPIYASNFPLSAAVGGSSFSNTGLITISAKTINCSLTPSSQLVGDTPIGYFQMSNDALPANSIISINSTLQTTFPNLFNAGPACTISNASYSCSLSTSFGQQFLTINSPPQSLNLTLVVSTINNPPYNGSFASIGIQIQNTAGYFMQVCSFQQQAVTTLRNSTSLTLTNWNSQVGATSTVSVTLSTFFKPYTTSLQWIFPSTLSVTTLTPASSALTLQNSSINAYITGTTTVGNSLTFSAQITNPTSVQSLASNIYVVYSATQFIERLAVTTMSLNPLSFTPTITLSESRTEFSSTYNVSITILYLISGGYSGSISISYGTFLCSNLTLISSTSTQVNSCTSNNFNFSSNDPLPQGLFWMVFNVKNYYSTINNSMTITLAGPSPSYYPIGTGTSSFNLVINNHSFAVTNSNPVFGSQTSITVVESTSSAEIGATFARIVTLYLPKDLVFSSNASVSALQNTIISSYSVSSTAASITLNTVGPVNLQINNIGNPIKYNGSLSWTIVATDMLSYPSSSSISVQQPMYTSTTLNLNYSFSDSTIEASNSVILTIIPTLQYYSPPSITITFSDSLVLSCGNCSLTTSNSLTITYFAAIMKVLLTVKNSNRPNGNSVSAVITGGSITYETGTVAYSLSPMTYGYSVSQTGMFGTVGNVNITITSMPSQTLTLTYSDISPVLSNPSCVSCSNSLVYVTGIVEYFQTYSVSLVGTYNGVVYANAVVPISYICSSIQGCNICANKTTNQVTTLICQQCFTSTYTPYSLLYNNICLQTCPISTYSNGITCVSCPSLCYICTIYQCDQCVSGYYIYNSTCLNSCPPPLVNNATHCISVPISCPNNCANCPTNDVCTACNGGYYLLSNVCYSSCPAGYKPSGSICILFIPPQQTSYFPFPFLISSGLIFIALLAMKCFQKRSLVMGNLIAFVSTVEVGSMIMTLVYTFQGSQDLVTQALCFILLFSKILINLIFLCYFLKAIAPQQQFEVWRQADEAHQKLYKALITLSSIFSFQIIRIIYSRLMGLRLFFGKFNTSLIFKPLNYFTLTYFLTAGAALVALSVRSILLQEGYHTSAFYSSIESIIVEAVLFLICIIDNKKGYDDEFFEYQVYKVNNEYESSHIDPVDIEHQDENGGSMHEMLNATVGSAQKTNRKKGSQIVRNPRWVRKIAKPLEYPQEDVDKQVEEMEQIEEVSDVPTEEQNMQENQNKQEHKNQEEAGLPLKEQMNGGPNNLANEVPNNQVNNSNPNFGIIQNKRESLFRRKIIEDWRKIEHSLPNKMHELRNLPKKKGTKKKHSASPQAKQRAEHQKQLKRVSSVEQMQIDLKLPESSESIPQRIKQYFHQQQPIKLKQKHRLNQKNEQKKGHVPLDQPKSMTLSAEQESSQDKQESLQGLLLNSSTKQNEHGFFDNKFDNDDANDDLNPAQRRRQLRVNDRIAQEFPSETQAERQSALEEEKSIHIEDQQSHERVLYEELHSDNGEQIRELEENEIELNANSQKKINLGNYRYKGDEQKDKRYKTKKRRVNRQTQQVYLQRLVASSDRKSRNLKPRKLQF